MTGYSLSGPYSVQDVKDMLTDEHPEIGPLLRRETYVKIARQYGLVRNIHNNAGAIETKIGLAEDLTKHLNYWSTKA
jgi:hypothetical protein